MRVTFENSRSKLPARENPLRQRGSIFFFETASRGTSFAFRGSVQTETTGNKYHAQSCAADLHARVSLWTRRGIPRQRVQQTYGQRSRTHTRSCMGFGRTIF